MHLGEHIVRFSMGSIPVVGNTVTGAIVGLTPGGAQLCDRMLEQDVAEAEIPNDCRELVEYLQAHGFLASQNAVRETSIKSAYLHVTNRCNLDCIGCYLRDSARNRAEDPSLEDLQRAVRLLADLGITQLIISGGEPFMRGDLTEIARTAKECGVAKVVVLTNGMLCSQERLVELQGVVDTISVSFDGASAEDPAFIRGSQLYRRLVSAVRDITDAGIHAHILATLHAKNIEDVPRFLTLGEMLKATVGFSLLSGRKSELGDLYPSEGCLARLAEIMFEHNASNGDGAVAHTEDVGFRACVSCGAGRTGVSVAADGSIYPCHMLQYSEFCLGNAFCDTEGHLRREIARFVLPTVDEMAGCSSCDKRYLCGGGCRARAYRQYDEIEKKDPYCTFYRNIICAAVDELNDTYH